jgi:hypothetical protein
MGHLGNWIADHAGEIFKLESIDALTAYVRVSFSNEDLEDTNLYSLIKLDEFDKSLHEYTQELNNSNSYWKNYISVKVAAYLYIGGLKVGALRTDLMTNWHTSKYDSLIALQNDPAKNSLWRSVAVNTPRYGGFTTTQNEGKAPMPTPSSKHLYGSNNQNNRGSFGGNGSKGASSSKGPWGHLKDAKAYLKVRKSLPFPASTLSAREAHLTLRATTRGTMPKPNSMPTSATSVVELMLALIVVRSATRYSQIVLSQSPDCLRVL